MILLTYFNVKKLKIAVLVYLYILFFIFKIRIKRRIFCFWWHFYELFVIIVQKILPNIDNYSETVKTNKYSQKGVDNEYLCEYNTDIANDQ